MEYMLFIATDTEPEPQDTGGTTIEEWCDEGERRGIRKQGERLRPPADATTVRVRKGELLVTDGPFTESKEWIAGYDIIDCADLDQAIDYASAAPDGAIRSYRDPAVLADGGLTDVADTIAAAHRSDWGRIVAGLIRRTGDWTLAEDAAQDAFAAALVRWPDDGIPDRPAAWLTTTARNRAIDRLRSTKAEQLRLHAASTQPEPSEAHDIADDRLELIFTCCHPAIAVGGPCGVDPADRRGSSGFRDRPRVPGVGGHHGAASGASATQDRPCCDSVPGSAARTAGGAVERSACGAVPGVQRRLQRRCVQRCGRLGNLARRGRRRSHAARVRSLRAVGAHADAELPARSAGSVHRANC